MASAALSVIEQELDLLATDYAAWAAECYTILDKFGRTPRLVLNPVQCAIGRAEREMLRTRGEARLYVLKARQGGVTTDQQARALHLAWSTPGAVALTMAQKREATDKIFQITQRALEHFPRALLPSLGGRETREISFPALDSHFYTETAGSGDAARGLTLWRLHGSEFAHWPEPRKALGAAAPAMVPRGSVIVLETTGSGFDSEGHQFWREAREGRNGYRALFFPWWQCDAANYRLPLDAPDELGALAEDERTLIAAHGLDAEQIKWRRAKMGELGRSEFLKEYAEDDESCWLSSGGLFYDAEILKALKLRAPAPREVTSDGVALYAPKPAGERVILGADTAEGGGGDRSTFKARAFPSWRQLASYASADVEPKQFAALLNAWGRTLGGDAGPALLVVEKNMHGITVLRELRDTHGYPVERIYHRVAHDRDAKQGEATARIGWATTAETHALLLDAGREVLAAAHAGTADAPNAGVIADAFAVRRDDNGKVSLNGRDELTAEMLTWQGRSYPVAAPRAWSV